MVAIGTQPITGDALATAMAKMIGGTKVDVGPDGIKTALPVARQAATPSTSTAPRGPSTSTSTAHEAQSDIDVWCVGKDGTAVAHLQLVGPLLRRDQAADERHRAAVSERS